MVNQDFEHLKLLGVIHYVLAAVTAFFSLIPVIHVAIGIAIILGAFDDAGPGQPPPPIVGWFFVLVASGIIVAGLTLAVCMVITGRSLTQHRNYMFCFVIAAIECLSFPFGTILGVFTIVVLMRPSVKELFAASTKTLG